jgi:hypothetical protein
MRRSAIHTEASRILGAEPARLLIVLNDGLT